MWKFEADKIYEEDFGLVLKFKNDKNRFVRFCKFSSPWKSKEEAEKYAELCERVLYGEITKEDNTLLLGLGYFCMYKTPVSDAAKAKGAEIDIDPVQYMNYQLLEVIQALIKSIKS